MLNDVGEIGEGEKPGAATAKTTNTTEKAPKAPARRKASEARRSRCADTGDLLVVSGDFRDVVTRGLLVPAGRQQGQEPVRIGVARLDVGDDRAAEEHENAVGEADEFGKIGGDDQHAGAGVRQRADLAVDVGLGGDVDPDGRLIEDDDLRFPDQPFRQRDLLLVAAAERADRGFDPRRERIEPGDRVADDPALLAAIEEAEPRERLEARKGGVLADRQIERDAVRAAVLGNERDAARDRRARRAGAQGPPVDRDAAGGRLFDPNTARAKALAPDPTRPVTPRISPRRRAIDTSANSPSRRSPSVSSTARPDAAFGSETWRPSCGRSSATPGSRWSRTGSAGCDVGAVAQHRDPIASRSISLR